MPGAPPRTYPEVMSQTLDLPTDLARSLLPGAVLDLLYDLVMQETVTSPSDGCVIHPTGRVRWLGATFNVRRVVWMHEHGALGDSIMVGTTCGTEGCVLGDHLVARTRSEHGRWLGGNGWKVRRQTTAISPG